MKKIKNIKLLAGVLIVLFFNFVPVTRAQVNSDCAQITFSQTVVPQGCTWDLGDNPTTTTNITNNGTLLVGSGTWTISGSYTQNKGGNLVFRGSTIDLAVGSMKIYNTDFTLNSTNAVRQQDVTVHNHLQESSSESCITVSLTKVVIQNSNSELKIDSNCIPIAPQRASLLVIFRFIISWFLSFGLSFFLVLFSL